MAGEYREVRDVIFSPTQERTEEMVGRPVDTLKNLKLTEEDFADIRNIQPFVLVEELLPIYETKFRGEENIDGVDCYVLEVRPRQILQGQRLFDGMLWVKKDDYAIVRSQGQAVPLDEAGKPFPEIYDGAAAHRRQALVSGLYARRRYAAIPHGTAANPSDDSLQRVQEVWRGDEDRVWKVKSRCQVPGGERQVSGARC